MDLFSFFRASQKPEPMLTNKKDGSVLVLIPEGPFIAGSIDTFEGGEPFSVQMPSYYLAVDPVTNAQFARFLKSTRPREAKLREWARVSRPHSPSNCQVFVDGSDVRVLDDKDEYPVVDVSWFGAEAYCKWGGVRLPSELEWEKGARGTDGREFPWGNDWDVNFCWNEKTNSEYTTAAHRTEVCVSSPLKDVSPYGLRNMVGNVHEWCADFWDRDAYDRYRKGDLTKPRRGADGDRLIRGGSFFHHDRDHFRCSYRYCHNKPPEMTSLTTGFRVARSV